MWRTRKEEERLAKQRIPERGRIQHVPLLDESAKKEIIALIDRALNEDIRSGDITSEACIDAGETISGRFLLKEAGRVAGLALLDDLFKLVDPAIEVQLFVKEGSEHPAGTVLGTVSGPARGIFGADRVALNVLQHLSGIATVTAQFVEQVDGFACDILDTRKTTPGLRCLEKYAVRVGGGVNHRAGLDDRFIIKRNHLAFISRKTRHAVIEACRRVREYKKDVVVEVEVTNLDMVAEALEAEADIIRLDHMPVAMVRKAIDTVNGRAYVEAAGGVTLDSVRAFAKAGVNGVSVAALTHSVPRLDITLRF